MSDKWKRFKGENKTADILTKMLFVFLALFPFGLVVPAALPGVLDQAWKTQRISSFVIAGTLFCCICAAWLAVPEKMTGKKKMLLCMFMFSAAYAVRLFVIGLLQAEPISDFYTCYEYAATGDGDREYLARYPYLGAYALTLRLILKIFGSSIWNAQVWNAFVTSLIPIAVYAAVSRMTGSQKTGAAAGFGYALCPSMIIYAAVPSCEHMSQFFLSLLLCAYAYYCTAENMSKDMYENINVINEENKCENEHETGCKNKQGNKHKNAYVKRWGCCVAIGSLLGFACIYKNLLMILAPCLVLTGILYEGRLLFSARNKQIKAAVFVLLQYAVMLILAWVIVKGGIAAVRTQLQADTFKGKGSYSATIYKGLCKEGNGVWNLDVQQYIDQVFEEHTDQKVIDQIFYGKLMDAYSKEPQALFRLIRHKFFIDWCSEDYYYWTFSGDGNLIQGSWIGEILFVIVPRIFFLIFCAVIACGFLAAVIRKRPYGQMQMLFYIAGVLCLFALALVLMEAQGRYKSNFMPFMCVVFGVGMSDLMKGIAVFKWNIRKEKGCGGR